jgi:hypothetical protein
MSFVGGGIEGSGQTKLAVALGGVFEPFAAGSLHCFEKIFLDYFFYVFIYSFLIISYPSISYKVRHPGPAVFYKQS